MAESDDDLNCSLMGVPLPTRLYGYQLRAGRWLRGGDTYAAVVNEQLAGDAGVGVGDRVTFDLGGDPQSVGGSFTAGGNGQLLYTDANGAVTTAYVPGTRSSPTDGVIVRACYGTSDTDPNLALMWGRAW